MDVREREPDLAFKACEQRNHTGMANKDSSLKGKRVAVVLLSDYPNDPRPRRAAEALAAEGMEVDVICIKRTSAEPGRERIKEVNVLRIPMQHRRGGKFAYAAFYSTFLAISFLLLFWRTFTRRYHLVHVHNMPDILVFSAIVPRIFGAKVILDLHDPMPELMRTIFDLHENSSGVRLLKFLEKISIRCAHAVITVNRTCRKIFSSRSCDRAKVTVVMNAPDENIFAFRPIPPVAAANGDKPFAVMYHGSLVERNGLALAVEAIGRVRTAAPNVELRIYGDRTPFLESVLESAREQGMEDCVRYLGPKTIEEIVSAIDECDVGIVPNLKNIFTEINTPTRIFEFLSRGKPVIAPSSPGILEYFGDDELVSFELGNAEELAERIAFAACHPGEVREITKRGQQVCRSHRWSEERREFVSLVRNLVLKQRHR